MCLITGTLALLGFTKGGIAGGSMAAVWMSSAATASGGGIAAGSAIAIAQSIAATGSVSAVTGTTATIGGTLMTVAYSGIKFWLTGIPF